MRIHFYSAWVESKAKLVYDNISDWLEGEETLWAPENEIVHEQVMLLKEMSEKHVMYGVNNMLSSLKSVLTIALFLMTVATYWISWRKNVVLPTVSWKKR